LEDVRDFGLVLQERHQVTTQVAARIGNGEEKVLQAVSELLVLTESLKTWTGNV